MLPNSTWILRVDSLNTLVFRVPCRSTHGRILVPATNSSHARILLNAPVYNTYGMHPEYCKILGVALRGTRITSSRKTACPSSVLSGSYLVRFGSVSLACTFFVGCPARRQGDEKLVYRLIQLFSSTEIFSKRRKICT